MRRGHDAADSGFGGRQIEEARQYLNRQTSGLGRRFLDDLAATLLEVASRPESFSHLETLPDEEPDRRALLRIFRYAVVFEIQQDVIVAVAQTSRLPNYWLGRKRG